MKLRYGAKLQYPDIEKLSPTTLIIHDTMYYYCVNYSNMGGKLLVVNNTVATLVDATLNMSGMIQSKNKLNTNRNKNSHVYDYNSANTFVLESLIADDPKVKLYINNVEQEHNVDFKIEKNKTVKMTSDVAKGNHAITWFSNETKELKKARYRDANKLNAQR